MHSNLDLDAPLVEKLALLLNQTEMLNWLLDNVVKTRNLQQREISTLAVAIQASETNETAINLIAELHRPSRWKRWLSRAKQSLQNKQQPATSDAPEPVPDPLAETIPQ